MRLVTAVAAWVAAVMATVYVAHYTDYTEIGPVVLTVGPAQGIHLGDIGAGVAAAAWATVITIALFATSPRRRRRRAAIDQAEAQRP